MKLIRSHFPVVHSSIVLAIIFHICFIFPGRPGAIRVRSVSLESHDMRGLFAVAPERCRRPTVCIDLRFDAGFMRRATADCNRIVERGPLRGWSPPGSPIVRAARDFASLCITHQ
jgi:hypothetical protein